MSYQADNDRTLQYILDKTFFDKFRAEQAYNGHRTTQRGVELFITTSCPYKCTYCYVAKYGEELYPSEIRNEEMILTNLRLLLDWFIKEDFDIPTIDLFAGEIWGLDLANHIFDTLLEYCERGLRTKTFLIPANCSFTLSPKRFEIVENYIDAFSKLGRNLIFSISIDGAIIEEMNRPFQDSAKNKLRDQEFYDKLFSWAKRRHYYFHPMVNSSAAKYWTENFKWWGDMFNKYGMTYDWFMMLEVRNDDWTVETIREYLCFLDYVFETYKRDVYLNDIQFMAADVMRLLPNHRSPFHAGSYNSISLASSGDNLSCSLSRNMIVRLGDLALCPCHRLSYPHLLYGNLKTENGEITGITSNNIQFAEHCLAMNSRTSNLGCDVCKLKNICLQGCYGSQYEARKDPFITIPSVCSLFYEKTRFLLKKYEESGILNYLFNGTFGEYDRFTNKQAINRLRTIYFDLIKELTNGQ